MGVAVITRTSGLLAFFVTLSLWATPNLCCSSIITRLKFLNSTSSSISECVPTTTSISPALIEFFTADFSLTGRLLFNKPALTPNCDRNLLKLAKCCSASISVGAITTDCQPLCMEITTACMATTVFPLPTSPCRSRCMGLILDISFFMRSMAFFCA